MQLLTIRVSLWVFLVCYVSSCDTHPKMINLQSKKSKNDTCFLIQEYVSIGNETFEPFTESYDSFMKEDNHFDMLIRVLGQTPKLIRITSFYANKDELIVRTFTSNDNYEKLVAFDVKPLLTRLKESNKLYHCNPGSTDFGTEIYLLKVQGKLVLKIWIENGRYDQLINGTEPLDINLSILKDLLNMIYQPR